MSKIIQITEENFRLAVKKNDLSLLAPDAIEKTKVKLVIRIIKWGEDSDGRIFPYTKDLYSDTHGLLTSDFSGLIGKPPMTMTLEWEE